MPRPRLGQFSFNPYQPEIDEDLQNELLAQSAAPSPLGSLDEADLSDYGLDANDPEIMAAYMRLKNRKRDPAMYENPNAAVGSRISDILTGIGAVMQKRSPLQDIGAVQAGRLAEQRRMQEQALGEEKLDISNLANLAKMRQAKSQLALKQQELSQRPELAKERLRQQFEQNLALQSAITGRQVDLQKARQQFEEGLKTQEREFKESQFEKEARLKRELEAMKQSGAKERQASKASQLKSGKPPTAEQFKAGGFARRMELSEADLGGVLGSGFDPASIGTAVSGNLPRFLEFAKPENVKSYENAKRNFVSAVLRRESGAAISNQEYESEQKKYFPQAGDSQAVQAQKSALRQQAINNMKAEAGPAFEQIPAVASTVARGKSETKTIGNVKYEKHSDGKWYPVK